MPLLVGLTNDPVALGVAVKLVVKLVPAAMVAPSPTALHASVLLAMPQLTCPGAPVTAP